MLRVVCELSTPLMHRHMKNFSGLLNELTAAAELSIAIDEIEPVLRTTLQWPELVADVPKLTRLFDEALETAPNDALPLLRLAAQAPITMPDGPRAEQSLLQLLSARLLKLLRGLTEQ